MMYGFRLRKRKSTVRPSWNKRESTSQKCAHILRSWLSLHFCNRLFLTERLNRQILHMSVTKGLPCTSAEISNRKKPTLKRHFHRHTKLLRKQSRGIRQGRFHSVLNLTLDKVWLVICRSDFCKRWVEIQSHGR